MNDVNLSEEDRQAVSAVYNKYQTSNQKAHDIARAQISEEFDIGEEEAEAHPEMEDRFETIRNNMNDSGIVSVDPNTGEPGKKVPMPRPTPTVSPKFQPAAPSVRELEFSAGAIEYLLESKGLTVLQSASDYTQGVITFIVTKQ